MKLESSTGKVKLDPQPPFGQDDGIVVEQRKVIDVAHIGRAQYFGREMIETIQIEIGKKLAGQIADGETAAAAEWQKWSSPSKYRWTGSWGFELSTIRSSSASVDGQLMRRRNSEFRIE